MDIYTKTGLLFVIQVDHLSGEIIGDLIESFYSAGAKNVQVISTITKKNRPAYMIVVDGNEASADEIERVIVEECGSSGWHRISTKHRHTAVSIVEREIWVYVGEDRFVFTAKGKQIAEDLKNIRPEYESCVSLREKLQFYKKQISIREIYARLADLFHNLETDQLNF